MAAVYTSWSHLDHAPFRLLTYMALVSLDRDDPPRFWGGRDDLAHALGCQVPREPDDDDDSEAAERIRSERRNVYEKVRANLRKLKDAHVITVAKSARQGMRAEYRLHLQAQAQPGAVAQAQPGAAAQAQPAGVAGSACAQAQAHPGPKEESGLLGTLRGEDRPGRSVSPATPRRALNGSDDAEHLGGRATLAAAVGAP